MSMAAPRGQMSRRSRPAVLWRVERSTVKHIKVRLHRADANVSDVCDFFAVSAVADPMDARPCPRPIFFHFHAVFFWGNLYKIVC